MDRLLIVPFTARPKRMAKSTAPLFDTGNTPGSGRSTAEACVFGAAPDAVEAPEKILLLVSSCACVSMPTTISQAIAAAPSARQRAQQLAGAPAVDQHGFEVGLRPAQRGATLGGHAHDLAEIAQRDAALPGGKAQSAVVR